MQTFIYNGVGNELETNTGNKIQILLGIML